MKPQMTALFLLLSIISTLPAQAGETPNGTCEIFNYGGATDTCALRSDESGIAPVDIHYGTLGTESLALMILGSDVTNGRNFAELGSRIRFVLQGNDDQSRPTETIIPGDAARDRLTFVFADREASSLYISFSRIEPRESGESVEEIVREIFGREATAILVAAPRE